MKQGARAFLGAVALTGLGFSLGVATDRLWLSGSAPVETPDDVRGRLMEDLRETVHLSEEQVAAVHLIFSRYQVIISSAWDDLQPQLEAALDSAFIEINAVLDPGQAREFHEWFARTHPLPKTVSR